MPSAATWMDLEIIKLSESQRKKNIWYHLYVESKRMLTNILISKQKQTQIINLWLPKGKGERKYKLGVWH